MFSGILLLSLLACFICYVQKDNWSAPSQGHLVTFLNWQCNWEGGVPLQDHLLNIMCKWLDKYVLYNQHHQAVNKQAISRNRHDTSTRRITGVWAFSDVSLHQHLTFTTIAKRGCISLLPIPFSSAVYVRKPAALCTWCLRKPSETWHRKTWPNVEQSGLVKKIMKKRGQKNIN